MRVILVLGALTMLLGCGGTNDSRDQALALAQDDIACTESAECCAVVDSCLASVLLVSANHYGYAKELLGEAPQEACLACITPAVQVDCRAGRCVAVVLEPDGSAGGDWPAEFARDHCGALEVPAGWQERPAATGQRAPLATATVIGCGD